MDTATSFILEYIKFFSTFVLLMFSATAWIFGKEIGGNRKLVRHHLALLLSFSANSVSAYCLISLTKNVFIETTKPTAERNLVSDAIKCLLQVSEYSLLAGVILLGIYVFNVYMKKETL